jgi:hypothetical protein
VTIDLPRFSHAITEAITALEAQHKQESAEILRRDAPAVLRLARHAVEASKADTETITRPAHGG